MTRSASFKANPSVVSCELEGGSVLLDLDTSTYFSLNPVGLFIWEQLASLQTKEQLRMAVQTHFEVDPAVCAADIDRLLAAFAARKLIKEEAATVG